MGSITHSKALALSTVRTTAPVLDLLPSVLTVIQRASKKLKHDVKDDRALCDFYIRLQTATYSIWSMFRDLQAAGLDAGLKKYAAVILDAVEEVVEVRVCEGGVSGCGASKMPYTNYPKSHALFHLANTDSTDQPPSYDFSFPDSSARDSFLGSLERTFDELQEQVPVPPEPPIPPARKRRRDPQWTISNSACQVFRAISQCPLKPGGCDVIKHLEAHLALATYSNISEEEEHFVDMLLALDTETPLWNEVRIHTHSPTPFSTNANTRPAVREVMFHGKINKVSSAARKWWMKEPKRISHFCKLVGASSRHLNATFCVNLTIGADNDIWRHRPTPRVLGQGNLSDSVSLAAILTSDTRDLTEMAKLVLAVILSYSLFYLYEGPWLGARNAMGWSRENIVFFKKDGKVPLRPFLRSDLRDNALDSDKDSEDDNDDASFHPYPILVGFGVTLLEIHLGKTLEAFLGLTEPLTSVNDKWARACEVFEKRKPFILGQNYRHAIQSCLDTQFGAGDDSADENEHSGWNEADEMNIEQLRGLIFSKIVEPLQNELEYGFGAFIQFGELDKQAAVMDLVSGLSTGEVVDSPMIHHNHTNSTHEQIFSNPNKSTRKLEKAAATAHLTSKESDGALLAPNSLESTDTGELYTVYGDPNAPPTLSLQEYGPTDVWFKKFKALRALCPLQELDPDDPRRVRVAVIDSGIDMGHVDIQAAAVTGRIVKVCDWADGRDGVEDENAGDSSGHGTHVASIILDMAPSVDLYIARVTKGHEMSHSQAENVAKAIHVASSTWKCAIINLSLGFSRGIPSIEHALESATNAGVLVFAAASNDGANSGLAYPAWHSRVMCIHSTDGYGNRSRFSPLLDERDHVVDGFSIVGEHVCGAWPLKDGTNDSTRRMSGTSFATPVAAALAACILRFAHIFEGLDTKNFYKLTSYDGMRRVFLKMSILGPERYRYLNPIFFNREDHEIVADLRKALNPEKR